MKQKNDLCVIFLKLNDVLLHQLTDEIVNILAMNTIIEKKNIQYENKSVLITTDKFQKLKTVVKYVY